MPKVLRTQNQSLPTKLTDDEVRKVGFRDGIHFIAREAELQIAKSLGLKTRDQLRKSGKLPPFWIATLITCKEHEEDEDSQLSEIDALAAKPNAITLGKRIRQQRDTLNEANNVEEEVK